MKLYSEDELATIQEHLLWDRKEEGGFPGRSLSAPQRISVSNASYSLGSVAWTNLVLVETKELKRRVRDIIDPARDLGHVDGKKSIPGSPTDPFYTLDFPHVMA